MPVRLTLPLDRPVLSLPPLAAGAKVIVSGALRSAHDGAIVDAVKTEPAPGAPAALADPGGLVDFRAGGLRIVEVGPEPHQISAVVTGEPGPACQALGVASPCLPTRSLELARARLLTKAEWLSSLEGELGVAVPDPPLVSLPPAARSPALAPALGGLLIAALAAGAFASWRRRRSERARSPLGRLVALAERVRAKAVGAPPELSAPLEPALAAALRSLHEGRIDPASPQGVRVADTLRRVEARLDEGGRREREDAERSAADALVLDVESALEAAEEAARLAPTIGARGALRRLAGARAGHFDPACQASYLTAQTDKTNVGLRPPPASHSLFVPGQERMRSARSQVPSAAIKRCPRPHQPSGGSKPAAGPFLTHRSKRPIEKGAVQAELGTARACP